MIRRVFGVELSLLAETGQARVGQGVWDAARNGNGNGNGDVGMGGGGENLGPKGQGISRGGGGGVRGK